MAQEMQPFHYVVVRNTFVEVMDEHEVRERGSILKRSNSDGSLSKRSTLTASSDQTPSQSCLNIFMPRNLGSISLDEASQAAESYASGVSWSSPWDPEQGNQGNDVDDVLPEGVLPGSLVDLLQKETGLPFADLIQLDSAGILSHIPRNDQGEISSVGSMKNHFDGTCVPCIFWFRGQCTKSLKCSHCHFRHPGQKAKRHKPSKRSRQFLREQRAAAQAEECAAHPFSWFWLKGTANFTEWN
eukprot:TRINITY_DN8092_c1_g1_i8.p1 TRINITY_DN8092_c1_g1~~TRINITY_DN8092_c1_g1_i8.p1  ORF type:complete len:242 (-),score=34.01 TRINITY_DN8092_c1_g1_i8:39-764(-)